MTYTYSGRMPSRAAIAAAVKTDLKNAPTKPNEFALYILTIARELEALQQQKAEPGPRQ